VVLGKFLNSDEAPWNYLMAASMVFALPPLAIYYIFRRYMSAGLTMGGSSSRRTRRGKSVLAH